MQKLLSKLLENRAQALGLHLKRLVELLLTDIGHDSLAIVALAHPGVVCQRSHHHARKLIYIAHLCRSAELFSCDADAYHLTTLELTGTLIVPRCIYDRFNISFVSFILVSVTGPSDRLSSMQQYGTSIYANWLYSILEITFPCSAPLP